MKKKVQTYLEKSDIGNVTQLEVAASFSISIYQLIRALHKEHTLYSRLLLEERKRRYLTLIAEQPRASFKEISATIGYRSVNYAIHWVRDYANN